MRPLILLAAPVVLAACAAAFPSPTAPIGLRPITAADARGWAASTLPRTWQRLTFSWRMRRAGDDSHGGIGSVYILPPDSLFLDAHCALGLCSYEAAVVGDSTLWAEPRDQVQQLAPSYELLSAIVGLARPPKPGWTVESHQDAKLTSVVYTHGADTIQYVRLLTGQSRLETYVVENGKPLGRVWANFDQLRHVKTARMVVYPSPAQLDISFDSLPKQKPLAKDAWNAPTSH